MVSSCTSAAALSVAAVSGWMSRLSGLEMPSQLAQVKYMPVMQLTWFSSEHIVQAGPDKMYPCPAV